VAWKRETAGEGQVIPPLRRDGKKVDKHTPGNYLRATLEKLGLSRPGLGWYEATRHTFASHWVMAGGSIEKLKEILGHYSVVVTERYAHLRPELFPARDLGTIAVDMERGPGESDQTREQNWIQGAGGHLQAHEKRAKRSEPPCKPSLVPGPAGQVANIPLGLTLPCASSELTRRLGRADLRIRDNLDARPRPSARAIASLFALAPGGVCHAMPVTRHAVRSYRTVSPLPRAP
jgi:Phage integrase family